MLTSYLGMRVIRFYHEVKVFMIWFLVANSQYSLLKSSQPDPCSPRHDFNRFNAYNRAFYFCLFSGVILLLDTYLHPEDLATIELYGVTLRFGPILEDFKTLLVNFLPWFPLIYTFGLLPQVNTFVIWFLEQLNLHLFGGTGNPTLAAAIIDCLTSCGIVAVLYGIGYSSRLESSPTFLFSLFLGFMVGLSYFHSRFVKDPALWIPLISSCFHRRNRSSLEDDDTISIENPSKYPVQRLVSDILWSFLIGGITTGVHISTMFDYFYPHGFYTIAITGVVLGFLEHYFIPMFRKPHPFMLFQEPFFETVEGRAYEPSNNAAKATWFERVFIGIHFIEVVLIYPALFLTAITNDRAFILSKFGLTAGVLLISVVGLRLFRGVFTDTSQHYLILSFTLLFFEYDARQYAEFFILDYFIGAFFVYKLQDIFMKIQFLLIYAAPWNLSWGSVAHAVIQPLSVPHTVLWAFQVVWSALVSAPLYPFMGSTAFFLSYGRPVKFWERGYNTTRVDNSQRKLSETLSEGATGGVHNDNLNSIFYEHLMASLQSSLQKEIEAGRLGNVSTGDFYIIGNDKLTAMLHLIEIGNGFCTFQVRGMEFKGTYCQERELEAINREEYSDSSDDPPSFCTLSGLISFGDMMRFRWNSWEPVNPALMLNTYSIGLNPANSILNSYQLKSACIKYYIMATIYYFIHSSSFESWIGDVDIVSHGLALGDSHVDMDPLFSAALHEDFDAAADGISLKSFGGVYGDWIKMCFSNRLSAGNLTSKCELKEQDCELGAVIFNTCFSLSVLARRALLNDPEGNNSEFSHTNFVERYYSLFKGDIRITSMKDEFILSQIDIIQKVIGKAARMSLKLHQDSFIDDFEELENIYQSLESYGDELVVCHEGDPRWRQGVLAGVPNLLSLRKVADNSSAWGHSFSIVTLTLRHMKFRVIKLNRESVRGLWAGQVQELVFLGNTNSERGSIQQLKTVVRNLVNQSCDFPVGYPAYVSPLTTSYASFWPEILPKGLFPPKENNNKDNTKVNPLSKLPVALSWIWWFQRNATYKKKRDKPMQHLSIAQ